MYSRDVIHSRIPLLPLPSVNRLTELERPFLAPDSALEHGKTGNVKCDISRNKSHGAAAFVGVVDAVVPVSGSPFTLAKVCLSAVLDNCERRFLRQETIEPHAWKTKEVQRAFVLDIIQHLLVRLHSSKAHSCVKMFDVIGDPELQRVNGPLESKLTFIPCSCLLSLLEVGMESAFIHCPGVGASVAIRAGPGGSSRKWACR